MRPEDAAAREVPVPQAAAAAVERGVDAAAHRVVDQVGLARAGRLPVEGEAQDQQHEAGGGGERDRQRGVGAPGRQRVAAQLDDARSGRGPPAACAPSRRRGCRRRARFRARRRWRRGWSAAARRRARRCSRRPIGPPVGGAAAVTMPSALLSRMRRPNAVARAASARSSMSRRAGRRRPSAARPAGRSARRRNFGDRRRCRGSASAIAWRRWSSTCTTAPTPMVSRKAMISAGTARRSAGSAVSSRR